jgi:uncharacterized protein
MILTNEFTVRSDVETVWRHLLDMEEVAGCLPGATIEATDDANTFNGSMRVRVGPLTVNYEGVAVLQEVDEEQRTATISLQAREQRGQGTAMATIRNRLEPTGEGTRVLAETDLHVTGPQAQFGRGVMEDVGSRVLAEFSRRLEEQIAGGGNSQGHQGISSAPRGGAAPTQAARETDSLDLGSLVAGSVAKRYQRYAAIAAICLAVLAVRHALRRG